MEKEVVSREGPAAAQLVMALLHCNQTDRPSATQALRLPLFTEESLDDLQGMYTASQLWQSQSLLPGLARGQQSYLTGQQVGVIVQDVLVCK